MQNIGLEAGAGRGEGFVHVRVERLHLRGSQRHAVEVRHAGVHVVLLAFGHFKLRLGLFEVGGGLSRCLGQLLLRLRQLLLQFQLPRRLFRLRLQRQGLEVRCFGRRGLLLRGQ